MLPANWLTEIIKVAGLCVLAITLYTVFWPRIKVMLGERHADLRRIELSAQYQDLQVNGDDIPADHGLVLRHVKAAVHNGELICLFVNDGGSALTLRIEATDEVVGTIGPGDYLETGQTGSIRLRGPVLTTERDILFTIRYEDERGYVHRDQYRVDGDERTLRRQDAAVDKSCDVAPFVALLPHAG